MTKRFLCVSLLLALAVPVAAQRVSTFEQVTVANSSIGLTAAKLLGMASCTIRLETAQVRWRADGTAPTSSVGTLMEVGDVLTIPNIVDAAAIRFIRTGATSGVLDSSCFPQP